MNQKIGSNYEIELTNNQIKILSGFFLKISEGLMVAMYGTVIFSNHYQFSTMLLTSICALFMLYLSLSIIKDQNE